MKGNSEQESSVYLVNSTGTAPYSEKRQKRQKKKKMNKERAYYIRRKRRRVDEKCLERKMRKNVYSNCVIFAGYIHTNKKEINI